MSDPTTGYRVLDYFNDGKHMNFEIPIPYLGTIDKISAYMEKSHSYSRGQVYYCLPLARACEIRKIIDYCENHWYSFIVLIIYVVLCVWI